MTTETIGKEALDHVCGDAASFYDDNHTKYRESCQKKKNLQIFSICVKLKKNQVLGASKAHLQSEN